MPVVELLILGRYVKGFFRRFLLFDGQVARNMISADYYTEQ